MTHIIVVGNEKGGSGKSTTCMHLATALERLGFQVAGIDLDTRQRSFTRYVANRVAYLNRSDLNLPTPVMGELPRFNKAELDPNVNYQVARFTRLVDQLSIGTDFIIIDCPGSHTRQSQMAHSLADTLITPMNDSFVDFDMLAHINPHTSEFERPSIYSEMVWKARQARAELGKKAIDWIVIRNRLGTQNMHNKRKVGIALDKLGKRIGFRVAPGLSERVVFREMFTKGLTLLDLADVGVSALSMSNIAARQELRELVKSLKLPGVDASF